MSRVKKKYGSNKRRGHTYIWVICWTDTHPLPLFPPYFKKFSNIFFKYVVDFYAKFLFPKVCHSVMKRGMGLNLSPPQTIG